MKTPRPHVNSKCWTENTRILLVVSHWKDDLIWLFEQEVFPYVVAEKLSDDPICGVPVNLGAEASSYLKFILNNFRDLPRSVAFLDEHERSWHQPFDMIEKLSRLDTPSHDAYIPLNDLRIDSEDKHRAWDHDLFKPVWDAVVRPHLEMECPARIICDGSSQFLVSRDLILARPISLYEDLYRYTVGTKRWPGDEKWRDARGYPYRPGGKRGSWKGGVYFLEWIWHIVFGQPSILYPVRP